MERKRIYVRGILALTAMIFLSWGKEKEDLFAFPGYPTTREPVYYGHRVIDRKAVVLKKDAGAVPVANLTGHPCLVIPDGLNRDEKPTIISIIGHLLMKPPSWRWPKHTGITLISSPGIRNFILNRMLY